MVLKKYRTNATTRHFEFITKFIYIITSTNYWFEDYNLPRIFVKIYNKPVSAFLEVIIMPFAITPVFARCTQDNLTEKQKTYALMDGVSFCMMYAMYIIVVYHKQDIRELLFLLSVKLKGMYNDETLERKMIKKTWISFAPTILLTCCALISQGVLTTVRSLTSNETFTTIIPIWPDVEDRRLFAGFFRIIVFIMLSIVVVRSTCSCVLIVSITVCLRYQFANLYEYFSSLNDIFDGEGSQEEKEIKYEEALKVGIRIHNITLNCVDRMQSAFSLAYTGQVAVNACGMVLILIALMQSDRSFTTMAPTIFMAVGMLVPPGLILCSAGDITVEAERLATAMFHSGWHHCTRQSSVRVRKLITILMAQAQQVVVIKILGNFELSYASYVTMVKSSYSVLSLIY